MTRLTILHTNDLHARVTQLSRIAAVAKHIRREVVAAGDYCALWDCGDAEDTILFESSMTKGRAMMEILHSAGYELEVLGNATPLRYGPQAVPGLAAAFGRPLLCANMIDPATGQLVGGLEPYALQTFGDVTLGIIGLTAPHYFYDIFKLKLGEPGQILPGLIADLRARGATPIVLLSHLGSKQDIALAEQIEGLDVIIGAHDHVVLNPPLIVNRTLIVQAGDYGRFLGRLDLDIDSRGHIDQHHGQLIPIGEGLPLDPEVQQAFEAQRAYVQQLIARIIGTAATPIDLAHDRECTAGNLLADALRERFQAEVGLALSGHWQSGLPAGEISVGALYAACRSTANPGYVALSGAQIMQFLREALKPGNMAHAPTGLRGQPVGTPHVSGLSVRYHPAALDSIQVQISQTPLQPDRLYRVASTDMELSDFIGYLALPAEQVEYEVPTIMPEVLEDYLARHSPFTLDDQRFFSTAE